MVDGGNSTVEIGEWDLDHLINVFGSGRVRALFLFFLL